MANTRDAVQPSEDVEIRGHIIDSLILPKVLDLITSRGGTFRIQRMVARPFLWSLQNTWRARCFPVLRAVSSQIPASVTRRR